MFTTNYLWNCSLFLILLFDDFGSSIILLEYVNKFLYILFFLFFLLLYFSYEIRSVTLNLSLMMLHFQLTNELLSLSLFPLLLILDVLDEIHCYLLLITMLLVLLVVNKVVAIWRGIKWQRFFNLIRCRLFFTIIE